MSDPAQIFAQAEQLFRRGQLDSARELLKKLQRQSPRETAVHHLLALVEKQAGQIQAALAAFDKAIALSPQDPQIRNNRANIYRQNGELDRAINDYDIALRLSPAFTQAAFNRALCLTDGKQFSEARQAFAQLEAMSGNQAAFWSARGHNEREAGDLEAAAACYDNALQKDKTHRKALHGRAVVALERGEAEASARFQSARLQCPDDPAIILGDIQARMQSGDSKALDSLHQQLASQPNWAEGLKLKAEYHWEQGDARSFLNTIHSVTRADSPDPELANQMLGLLTGVDMYAAAAEEAARLSRTFPKATAFVLAAAVASTCAGDLSVAETCFARLAMQGISEPLAEARLRLRQGRVEEAAILLERAITIDSDNIAAWAHLDFAWRLTGDPQHDWLHGQAGLYAMKPLGLDADSVAGLADYLRALHTTAQHPVGQSMRNGTQTRGALLWRTEPEARHLRLALEEAVVAHWRQLPALDKDHPLLKHRDVEPRLRGSWSVRLTEGGFHVSHMHPHGLLSSASYWATPANDPIDPQAGFLELGRPPKELDIALEPLAILEPKPGHLALFPSTLMHGTRPFPKGERLSLAFDVVAP